MNFKLKFKAHRPRLWVARTAATGGKGAGVMAGSLPVGPRLGFWLGFRLALLAISLYAFQEELTWLGTLLAIHLVGTWLERVILGLLLGLLLSGCFSLMTSRLSSRWGYLGALVLVGALLLLLFQGVPPLSHPLPVSLFLVLVLALYLLPERSLAGLWAWRPVRWLATLLFIAGVGLAELLLLKPLIWWLAGQPGEGHASPAGDQPVRRWLPGVLLVSLLAALLTSAYSLAHWHRVLLPDPAVEMFAAGNFNSLELDPERGRLYVAGYGTDHLLAYHLATLDQPPLVSPVTTGQAQGFAYNPGAQELYVYNQVSRQLLVLDGTSLALKRAIPTPQVSPGDAWTLWDKFSDKLVIASEADEQHGLPFVVIDRASGQVVDALDLEPGNVLLHPARPWLYLSFFRRTNELLIYDTERLQIVHRTPVAGRLDRMSFSGEGEELKLLVASPVEGTIRQFEAESLQAEGALDSLFGVRTLAVDSTRNLLLSGSLVNNRVEVIDLSHNRLLASYYLGPWLRTIVLDTEAGLAYISTHEGLFKLRYAGPG